jgi:NAD(P)-dependent dehydrogenase (short-subunit alcohol dehydrogenase family)
VADRKEQAISDTVTALEAFGTEALGIVCNVSRDHDVAAMVARTVEHFGRLDIAFNNAGINPPLATLGEVSEEDFDAVIAVNLKGVWLCMRHELRVMAAQGSGSIVNTSSIAGLAGLRGCGAYSAAKHGVVGLTRTAALEYGKLGVRVNAVCPGGIVTPMLEEAGAQRAGLLDAMAKMEPIGRLGQPGEIASAVLWLCSPGASFMTGHALAVDGGWMAQ